MYIRKERAVKMCT